jgi:hypothetical protein
MKFLKIALLAALFAAGSSLSTKIVMAQGQGQGGGQGGQGGNRPNRGNFSPEEFRQRMMDRYRDELDIKDDAEWKLISERVSKVLEARRELGFPGGGFGRAPRRNANDQGGNQNADQGGRRRGGGFFGGEPSPEADALQKAIESKASADDIKGKLAKYRDSRKAKRANLEKAQDDLRQVLSVRQEAAAVMAGLLE